MKKPNVGMNGQTHKPFSHSPWADLYPTLWEYLTCSMFDDGETRTTASLTIFVQDGALKACINDRHFGRSAFYTAETMEQLLNGLDDGLQEDTLDWRVKKDSAGTGGRIPY